MKLSRILIVGYISDGQVGVLTQATELANILRKDGYDVLTVSRYHNKLIRLFHIIYYILFNTNKFDIAVVQFYSGNSFIWQYISGFMIKSLRKKLIFTIHGGGVPDKLKTKGKRYLSLLQKADAITCP